MDSGKLSSIKLKVIVLASLFGISILFFFVVFHSLNLFLFENQTKIKYYHPDYDFYRKYSIEYSPLLEKIILDCEMTDIECMSENYNSIIGDKIAPYMMWLTFKGKNKKIPSKIIRNIKILLKIYETPIFFVSNSVRLIHPRIINVHLNENEMKDYFSCNFIPQCSLKADDVRRKDRLLFCDIARLYFALRSNFPALYTDIDFVHVGRIPDRNFIKRYCNKKGCRTEYYIEEENKEKLKYLTNSIFVIEDDNFKKILRKYMCHYHHSYGFPIRNGGYMLTQLYFDYEEEWTVKPKCFSNLKRLNEIKENYLNGTLEDGPFFFHLDVKTGEDERRKDNLFFSKTFQIF